MARRWPEFIIALERLPHNALINISSQTEQNRTHDLCFILFYVFIVLLPLWRNKRWWWWWWWCVGVLRCVLSWSFNYYHWRCSVTIKFQARPRHDQPSTCSTSTMYSCTRWKSVLTVAWRSSNVAVILIRWLTDRVYIRGSYSSSSFVTTRQIYMYCSCTAVADDARLDSQTIQANYIAIHNVIILLYGLRSCILCVMLASPPWYHHHQLTFLEWPK